MSRVLLFHAHHGKAIGAPLRRQVKVLDLGKLLLQDRHEHFIQRCTQDRRLVGGFAGVGRVVDGFVSHGDALDCKDGKGFLLVVIARVVSERTFDRRLSRPNAPFEHDLARRRHLQIRA